MLEPKPGRQFASQGETKYIVPDVIVEKIDEEYVVSINDNSTPHLMVSSDHQNLLHSAEKDEALSKYLSDRVNSALWLIKSIEQRKQTIYNVVSAVVRYQKEFFEKGSKYLKTLTLKDIAEEVGIHESTVSRSINGKYMQCCKGVFEIKYFFSAGVAGSAEKESRPTASRNSLKRSLTKKIKSHRTAIRTWRCFRKKASRFRAERWQNTGRNAYPVLFQTEEILTSALPQRG